MQRRFTIYDVFSDRTMAGNQLGVVLDCDGLETAQMQAIAREFNFSETVFLMPPEDPAHTARMRIFVPNNELPFAGHPTVGWRYCGGPGAGSGGCWSGHRGPGRKCWSGALCRAIW